MSIADVNCHVLVDPDRDGSATSSAQDTIVVEIVTEDGVAGIGETDLNPVVARACIEAPSAHSMALGLREMLIGEDPLAVEALWERLYVGSAMTGRRGAGINAIGAIGAVPTRPLVDDGPPVPTLARGSSALVGRRAPPAEARRRRRGARHRRSPRATTPHPQTTPAGTLTLRANMPAGTLRRSERHPSGPPEGRERDR